MSVGRELGDEVPCSQPKLLEEPRVASDALMQINDDVQIWVGLIGDLDSGSSSEETFEQTICCFSDDFLLGHALWQPCCIVGVRKEDLSKSNTHVSSKAMEIVSFEGDDTIC